MDKDIQNAKIPHVHVENMTGRSGREVPNQFILKTDDGVYFQSYQSIIAFSPYASNTVYLDEKAWDYSTTTGKYRNQFLNETKAETQSKIKSGEYILTDLN